MSRSLTIFSWGYYGWGRATERFVELVDSIEKKRGFNPPIFLDCRKSRSVRALGFRDNEFRDLLGSERYVWMRPFGNPNIGSRKRRIIRNGGFCISDPSAADIFLHFAQQAAKEKRRLIFFCQCKYKWEGQKRCHRSDIAKLLLKTAQKQEIALRVVEWPGDSRKYLEMRLSKAEFAKLSGKHRHVVLPTGMSPVMLEGPAWASVANFKCGINSQYRVIGHVQWKASKWVIPLLDEHADGNKASISQCRQEAHTLVLSHGWAAMNSES